MRQRWNAYSVEYRCEDPRCGEVQHVRYFLDEHNHPGPIICGKCNAGMSDGNVRLAGIKKGRGQGAKLVPPADRCGACQEEAAETVNA